MDMKAYEQIWETFRSPFSILSLSHTFLLEISEVIHLGRVY